MIFDVVGKDPKFIKAPIGIFDTIINALAWLANGTKVLSMPPSWHVLACYTVEDMLTTEPSEKFGTITLREHYERIAVEGQSMIHTAMLAASLSPRVSDK